MVVKYRNRFPRQVVGVSVLKDVRDFTGHGPQQPDQIKQGCELDVLCMSLLT